MPAWGIMGRDFRVVYSQLSESDMDCWFWHGDRRTSKAHPDHWYLQPAWQMNMLCMRSFPARREAGCIAQSEIKFREAVEESKMLQVCERMQRAAYVQIMPHPDGPSRQRLLTFF